MIATPSPASAFSAMPLNEALLRALAERRYETPSPIQEQTIPFVLEGRDVMGCAQTGTGKTAAFALPILHGLSERRAERVAGSPRVLVVAPTRELALQIHESFGSYGAHLPHQAAVVFGGVGQNPQVQAMRRAPEILVATPGRLLDLIGQGHIKLDRLEVFVLDEADRMLDMGFIHDVRRLVALLPKRRQSLFFSATMPKAIVELASTILRNPEHVEVTPPATTVEKIAQQVWHVDSSSKREALLHCLDSNTEGLALVFTGMKHVANRIAEHLEKAGHPSAAIHGNKSQTARVRALEDFRKGKIRVLVATDIAARGIDVKGIGLIVNYDLPNEPDSYVHRIGRTARAGAEGQAFSLCDEKSQGLLRQIERNIRMSIPVDRSQPYHREPQANDRDETLQQQSRGGQRGGGGGGRRSSGARGGRQGGGRGHRR
jgi:ATP-dependent RNA helicase RhlE